MVGGLHPRLGLILVIMAIGFASGAGHNNTTVFLRLSLKLIIKEMDVRGTYTWEGREGGREGARVGVVSPKR